MTLISADNLFALVAVVVAGTAFAFWAESQRWGRQVSGPVWAILFGLVLSNTGVVPASTPVFSMVSDLLVPAAIPLLLFKANLRRIVAETGPMLLAFLIGVFGATLGAVLGFYLLVPEQEVVPVDLSVEEGFKLIMSAGLVTPGDVPTGEVSALADVGPVGSAAAAK